MPVAKTLVRISYLHHMYFGSRRSSKMPQYQQITKGLARIRVQGLDATRAYMLMMQKTGGKLQALPGGVFVIDETLLEFLKTQNVAYELIEQK